MSADIVLVAINSRYTHTSIGLRYLYANLKEYQKRCEILEFVINEDISTTVEKILAKNPRIIGIGVYIWNALDVKKIIDIIKDIKPNIKIVLGGPEASYLPNRVDFSIFHHEV